MRPVESLMTNREISSLREISRYFRPRVAVEIGSWAGASALIVAPHAGRLYCVDHWSDYADVEGRDGSRLIKVDRGFGALDPESKFVAFCENVGDRLFRTIFPCRGPSTLWAKVWGLPIDFLFIDGCHTYEDVKADIDGWTPHVREGGMIVGHDYGPTWGGFAMEGRDDASPLEFPGVKRAVDESFEDVYRIPKTSFWITFKGHRDGERRDREVFPGGRRGPEPTRSATLDRPMS